MKKALVICIAIAITFTGLALSMGIFRLNPTGENLRLEHGDSPTIKGGTYLVEGLPVGLKGGTTKYFGKDGRGDINGDGVDDAAFILTDEGGGSGTFYYVAAAIKTATGYIGKNAVFLGDRIIPVSTTISDQKVTVKYLDREPGAPMTAKPTKEMSLILEMSGDTLVAIDNQ